MTLGWTIFSIIIAIGCFFLLVGIIDGNRYVIVKNSFSLPYLKKECKFILISDLHNKVYGKDNEKLIKDIDKENPDFIIIAGDLITSHLNESYEPGINLVTELSKKYKIYYGMGNHETRIKVDTINLPGKFQELLNGIDGKCELLADKSIYLEDYNIEITGYEAPRKYFKRFKKFFISLNELETHIGKRKDNAANILIAHNPDFFETYSEWQADLVLSGHVHGGIMRLPILGGVIAPSFRLFPKYDGGIFKKGKTTMLLSRGLGAHSIPLRFFNPAELHVVNCLKES